MAAMFASFEKLHAGAELDGLHEETSFAGLHVSQGLVH